MATELISKEIDGKTYEFSQFGAKLGVRTLIKISKIVGKPMGIAFGSIETGDGKQKPSSLLDMSYDKGMLAAAIEALTERMDESEIEELLILLTSTTCLCDGAKIDFNGHYAGKYGHLFKVLRAALEVQYGNFFDALSDLAPPMPTPQTKTTPISNKASRT